MKKFTILIICILCLTTLRAETIKVMVITGGHTFDTLEFFQLFDGMKGIEYEHFEQPFANQKIGKGVAEEFDVVVFYDMWQNISLDERAAYLQLTQQGKPFLFLHHSLVSYQNWPEFENIRGGKYIEESKDVDEDQVSTYEHDVWVYCSVENYTPVTNGFKELRFFDEVYDNVQINENVKPLLRTQHPKSMEIVAWEHSYRNSTILYIQPGHDKRTFTEPTYQQLLLQAIRYLAQK